MGGGLEEQLEGCRSEELMASLGRKHSHRLEWRRPLSCGSGSGSGSGGGLGLGLGVCWSGTSAKD